MPSLLKKCQVHALRVNERMKARSQTRHLCVTTHAIHNLKNYYEAEHLIKTGKLPFGETLEPGFYKILEIGGGYGHNKTLWIFTINKEGEAKLRSLTDLKQFRYEGELEPWLDY